MLTCFDSHAHLDDARFDADRPQLLARLPEQGLRYVMNPGCDLRSSEAACALARSHDWIFAAVGSHPDDADHVGEALLQRYRTLVRENPRVQAIGEIGLDYHYEDVPRAQQQAAFRAQLALARELALPVIVHDREAHGDALELVRQFPEVTGVFHCFSGSAELALELVKLGWYIGFTGVLTFKNARRAVEAARALPLDRIVIETDCPYMAPEPHRGHRNDPGYVHLVAQKLAEIKGISPEQAAQATLENAKRLYRIA